MLCLLNKRPRAENAQQWRFAPGASPDGLSILAYLAFHFSFFFLRVLRVFA
jgi:hypothetical protein